MIYGAYGYTGELIAREAKRRGLEPILAGRDVTACQNLARELGLKARVFDCDAPDQIASHIQDVGVVLHCAGPFSRTSRPMLDACLQTGCHYLDITGEIPVFENIHQDHERIRQADVVAIPGVGFDVVPSDCLAAMLAERMPDASQLRLAFESSGSLSPGTTKTMIEGLGRGGAIREKGTIRTVPNAFEVRQIRFEQKPRWAVTIPWGDVATAFYSTRIPDIRVYLASHPRTIRWMRRIRILKPVLALPRVQRQLKWAAARWVKGPSLEVRQTAHCSLWGEVRNPHGQRIEMRLRVPEAYALTTQTALKALERVLAGQVPPGAWTPSRAFGRDFILEIEGVSLLTEG